LTIFRRDFTESSIVTLGDAYSFNLEYSEGLFVWSKKGITSYLLGEPFLWIQVDGIN